MRAGVARVQGRSLQVALEALPGAEAPGHVAEVSARLVKMKVHPLPIPIPSFDVSIYWHSRVENDAANRWLRDAMVELFSDRKRHA